MPSMYIVFFYKNEKISITTDPGTVMSVHCFFKEIGVASSINFIKELKENKIKSFIYKNILCFENTNEAFKAIKLMTEKCSKSLRIA